MGALFSLFHKPKTPDVVVPPSPPTPPTVDVSDVNAIANSRKRADAESARRGRSSLTIPLGGVSVGSGGVRIPT